MGLSTASRSRLVFFAGLLVAAYFIYTAAAGALQAHNLSEDRATAEKDLAQLEDKKACLDAVKSYVASDAYVEQEARRRLGYTRDGEVPFVVISPSPEPQAVAEGDWWQRLFPC